MVVDDDDDGEACASGALASCCAEGVEVEVVSSPASTTSTPMSTPEMGILWQSGMSLLVSFAPIMPAMRATPRTSPFLTREARMREAGVGLEKRIVLMAMARREVGGLCDREDGADGCGGESGEGCVGAEGCGGGMLTMWALPVDVRWVSRAAELSLLLCLDLDVEKKRTGWSAGDGCSR